jgi:hypothetical protein
MHWQNCRHKTVYEKIQNSEGFFFGVFYFIQYRVILCEHIRKIAKEHDFVDNGEKLGDLSTWQTRKTWVFHTVVHIIHSCTQGDLWTKGEQMPFLWKYENAENPPFFILRKNIRLS